MALENFSTKLEPETIERIRATAEALGVPPTTYGRDLIVLALDGFVVPLDPDVIARIKIEADQLGVDPHIYGRNLLEFALTQEDREGAELNRLRVEVAGLNTHMDQLTRSFIDGVEAILFNFAAREDERMSVTDAASLIDEFRRRLTEE